MGEIDPAFIQAVEHRPKSDTLQAEDIPLIDLSPLHSLDSDPDALASLAAQIGDACKNWGFFQVINHGIPSETQKKIDSVARKFFALAEEEKKKVGRDEVNPTGYYDTEHTKNVRDWKEVFDFMVQEPTFLPASHEPDDPELKEMINKWPQNPPEFREACNEYAAELDKLAFKLLELIALSLGLERDRFHGYFKDQTTFIRLNHYPPCPIPDLALGLGRHKDVGALTILAQDDVGGLQVKRKTDGEWICVKPILDAFIINVGDIIQDLRSRPPTIRNNNISYVNLIHRFGAMIKYESSEHRVKVNSEKERFSVPFLLNPAHYTMVEPVEELVNKQTPSKYKAYNWGKFFTTRKLSNYKKLDTENIQIHHFKNE